ncbi:matrixin family metalloprotease [bacterium]|nr:matrixin family metalloprotease [bacterium]
MKKFLLALIIMFLICPLAQAKMTEKDLKAGVEKCEQEKTSNCYRLLYQNSNINAIRYMYGMYLFQEKKFVEARRELSGFLTTDRNQNPRLDESAKQMIAYIDEQYKSKVKAGSEDNGNYLNEISATAKWQNPNNIKVYIEPAKGKEILFRRAFQTWDSRLMMIHFAFQTKREGADIICSYVEFIKKNVAGLTSFKGGFMKNTQTGDIYFKPPVTIDIATQDTNSNRPYTDNELLSIILHEVGHAIGILEHTKNKNDIMYYSTETYKNSQISNRDANTIKAIYSKK